MLTNFKKKKMVLIGVLTLILVCGGIYIGGRAMQSYYFDSMFLEENPTLSDDGYYSYLQLSSEKKMICTLNIYEIRKEPYKQILYVETLPDFFNDRDVVKISWGIDSYDLYFDSKEEGVFIYKYVNGTWIGKMFLDVEKTKNAISGNEADIYYFIGERQVETLKTSINPNGFEQISGQVAKNTIPFYFLEKLNEKL